MKALIQTTYTTITDNFKLALRYSIALAVSFVLIYIAARITGLYKITALRFINYIIYYPVGFAAIQKAYRQNEGYIDYFNGLMIGFLTSIMGQFWFALLFFIYLHIDTAFLNYLATELPKPLMYPRLSVFFVMMIEGIGMSAILSLTLMQYFKWRQGRWVVSHG